MVYTPTLHFRGPEWNSIRVRTELRLVSTPTAINSCWFQDILEENGEKVNRDGQAPELALFLSTELGN